jgi:hypothetical protein
MMMMRVKVDGIEFRIFLNITRGHEKARTLLFLHSHPSGGLT